MAGLEKNHISDNFFDLYSTFTHSLLIFKITTIKCVEYEP